MNTFNGSTIYPGPFNIEQMEVSSFDPSRCLPNILSPEMDSMTPASAVPGIVNQMPLDISAMLSESTHNIAMESLAKSRFIAAPAARVDADTLEAIDEVIKQFAADRNKPDSPFTFKIPREWMDAVLHEGSARKAILTTEFVQSLREEDWADLPDEQEKVDKFVKQRVEKRQARRAQVAAYKKAKF